MILPTVKEKKGVNSKINKEKIDAIYLQSSVRLTALSQVKEF